LNIIHVDSWSDWSFCFDFGHFSIDRLVHQEKIAAIVETAFWNGSAISLKQRRVPGVQSVIF
jgi:hypothetical protein